MAVSSELRAYVLELLEGLGPINDRSMFGGAGLFMDGVMFGLLTRGDILYFRTDDENREEYEAEGMPPFVSSRGDHIAMPYHQIPDHLFDDGDDMCAWAKRAWEAARRAKTKKKAR